MKVELFEKPSGSDLTVVNAARVSFGKKSAFNSVYYYAWDLAEAEAKRVNGVVEHDSDGSAVVHYLSDADKKLIKFLARGLTTDDFDQLVYDVGGSDNEGIMKLLWDFRRTPEHFAPFAHPHVSFHIKAPIFVARQLGKHQVGMVWSEVSRRYVDSEPEFYVPEVWRKRAENVKQGSSDEPLNNFDWYAGYQVRPSWNGPPLRSAIKEHNDSSLLLYQAILANGGCPEQARMVLPQSMMTEWVWTGSLYAWANVYNKRKPGSHAQRECWPIAEQIAYHMAQLFPVSWEALTNVP
jgi:thymidylate synthase (FAD)